MRTLLSLLKHSAKALPLLLVSTLFSITMLAETVTGVIHTKAANPLNIAHPAGRRTIAKEIKLLFGNDTEMLFYFTYSNERQMEVRTASVEEHLAPDTGEITRVTVEDERGGAVELDQNHDGIWTSAQSAGFSSYDSQTKTVRHTDGTSWVFGCLSAPGEPDHGKRYLTAIKERPNEDTYTIQYQNGRGTTLPNSSSRITAVNDQRGIVYSFIYKTLSVNNVPELIQIINNMAVSAVSFEYDTDHRLHLRIQSLDSQSFSNIQLLSPTSKPLLP